MPRAERPQRTSVAACPPGALLKAQQGLRREGQKTHAALYAAMTNYSPTKATPYSEFSIKL